MLTQYSEALEFARKAHEGQMYREGVPYIEHCIEVANKVGPQKEKIVALLHDVVEDTTVTYQDILREFGDEVALYVTLLTKSPNQTYRKYIYSITDFPLAVRIKIADVECNLAAIEKSDFNALKKSRLRTKYENALFFLKTVYEYLYKNEYEG